MKKIANEATIRRKAKSANQKARGWSRIRIACTRLEPMAPRRTKPNCAQPRYMPWTVKSAPEKA
jgi:hypothetical protein